MAGEPHPAARSGAIATPSSRQPQARVAARELLIAALTTGATQCNRLIRRAFALRSCSACGVIW